MIRRKFLSLILGSQLLAFAACYEDKMNYDLAEINEVTITASTSVLNVEQLGELSVKPEVSPTVQTDDDYTYEWKIIEPIADLDFFERDYYNEVLANTKDLKATVFAPAGKYMLLFTVKNERTGIRSYKEFDLTVNSGFYEGLLVAYDRENHSELGFVRKDGNVGLDLIRGINGLSLPGRTVQMNTLIVKQLKFIGLTTNDDHYLINPDDMMIMSDKQTLFSSPIDRFEDSYLAGNKLDYYQAPSDVFFINDGQVYADMGPDFAGAMAGMYSQAFYYADGPYDLFPFLFNGNNAAVIYFYDNHNKRFLQSSYNGRTLTTVTQRGGDAFDPANVGKTARAAMLGYNKYVYYIMTDGMDDYVYTIAQYSTSIAAGITKVNRDKCPNFANAEVFDARSDVRVIYYAVANKLYAYDILTDTERQVLALPDAERIADVHVYRANMWENTMDNDFGKWIYIAANNGSSGRVYQYALMPDGTLGATAAKSFDGFGTIVDIDYRNPND